MAEKLVERQKIKLNGVEYYLDSLGEDSQKTLNDVRTIDGEMQRLQISLSIANIAKNSLLKSIEENIEDFEEVPGQEKEEAEDLSYGNTPETEDVMRTFEEEEVTD